MWKTEGIETVKLISEALFHKESRDCSCSSGDLKKPAMGRGGGGGGGGGGGHCTLQGCFYSSETFYFPVTVKSCSSRLKYLRHFPFMQ